MPNSSDSSAHFAPQIVVLHEKACPNMPIPMPEKGSASLGFSAKCGMRWRYEFVGSIQEKEHVTECV